MGDTIAMLSVPSQIFEEAYDLRQKLLMEINETSFAVNDVMLYLNTHPDDEKALDFFHDSMQKREQVLKEYEKQYASLTLNCYKCESGRI